MTKQDWLNQVIENKDKLTSLVSSFHPSSNQSYNLPISAPNAERACEIIRKGIRKEIQVESATARFKQAIKEKNCGAIYQILQETWFGVPESVECWNLEGFAETVDLLDDPVEE